MKISQKVKDINLKSSNLLKVSFLKDFVLLFCTPPPPCKERGLNRNYFDALFEGTLKID